MQQNCLLRLRKIGAINRTPHGSTNEWKLTLAKTEIIYPKNVGTLVAMNFTSDKYSAPRTIEEIKILGAVLEPPAKQHCQCPFTSKLSQIGQIGSAV